MPKKGKVKQDVRKELEHDDDNEQEERSQSERETKQQDEGDNCMPERAGLQTQMNDGCSGLVLPLGPEAG